MFAICAPFVDTCRFTYGYNILIMLPLPIKVEKGGVHDVYHFVFPCVIILYRISTANASRSDCAGRYFSV